MDWITRSKCSVLLAMIEALLFVRNSRTNVEPLLTVRNSRTNVEVSHATAAEVTHKLDGPDTNASGHPLANKAEQVLVIQHQTRLNTTATVKTVVVLIGLDTAGCIAYLAEPRHQTCLQQKWEQYGSGSSIKHHQRAVRTGPQKHDRE